MKRNHVFLIAFVILAAGLIFLLWLGHARLANNSFSQAAQQTGGQHIKISKADGANLGAYITSTLRHDYQRIATRIGTMDGPLSFTIPVDSMTKQLAIHFTGDHIGEIDLIRPSGAVVSDQDPDIKRVNLANARSLTVDSPATGQWMITAKGSSAYNLSVDAKSELMLYKVAFVEANRDIHGGYFPINVKPMVGKPALLQVTLLGNDHPGQEIKDVSFIIVDSVGNKLADFPTRLEDRNDYIGSYTPSEDEFWIIATGHDSTGALFQREFIHPLSASSLEIQFTGLIPPDNDQLLIGTSGEFLYTIQNQGKAGPFQIVASDTVGITTEMECEPIQCTVEPAMGVGLGKYGQVPANKIADVYLDHDQINHVRVTYKILPEMPIKKADIRLTVQRPKDYVSYNSFGITFDMVKNLSP